MGQAWPLGELYIFLSVAPPGLRPYTPTLKLMVQGNHGWPEAGNGHINECTAAGGWAANAVPQGVGSTVSPPYSASTSFNLPVSANLLFFFSNGSLAHGSVKVEAARDDGDEVKVDVVVSYWTQTALDRANVCVLERGHGQHGIGIIVSSSSPLCSHSVHLRAARQTPRWNLGSYKDQLKFDLTIRVPVSANASPRLIKELEMQFGNFAINFEELQGLVDFHELHLRTSNMPVSAGVSDLQV